MGLLLSNIYYDNVRPSHIPDSNEEPTFDPEFGFKAPRKKREMKMTEQEMIAFNMPKQRRDYCAHLHRDYIVCRTQYTLNGLCYPERRLFEHCLYEDYVIRMKEYEREKRLRMRQLRLEGKTIS